MPAFSDGGQSHDDVAGHRSTVDQVHIAVIKLDGKLDSFVQVYKIRNDGFDAELRKIHETQVMNHAAEDRRYMDHENRVRALESRRYVEPKTVWQAVGLLTTIGSLVIAVVSIATR